MCLISSLEKKLKEGVDIHLVYCRVDAFDSDPIGNEPLYHGEKLIGVTTSGAYGHYVRKSLAFAYVNKGYDVPGTTFEIELLGKRRKVKVLDGPAWDPTNKRMKT